MDAKIDFTTYSLNDLYSSSESIDREKYPDTAKEIDALIFQKEQESSEVNTQNNPISKIKLIRVTLKKEHIWYFKIGMLLTSAPALYHVYDILSTGVATSRGFTYVQGEDRGYYSHLFMNIAISFLFLWVGTFGSSVEKSK
jgi:hypothetical protein